jgi:hypothetical protein
MDATDKPRTDVETDWTGQERHAARAITLQPPGRVNSEHRPSREPR